MGVPQREKQISPTEAVRAIYFDFEGFEDEAPVLLGTVCAYQSKLFVLDEELRPAAQEIEAEVASLNEAVETLFATARDEDRRLVAFTQHEKQQIERWTHLSVPSGYRDAHKVACRWRNSLYREASTANELHKFLDFIGFERPTYLGYRRATHQLQGVYNGLKSAPGTYEGMTRVQKQKWTKVTERNRIDCVGLRDLTIRAASELNCRDMLR